MTWGTSKYTMKGVHELANEKGRVVVTGHAAEVGIVGWSMGGGHSPLSTLHGLGVDQMLEVELVGADGSHIIANVNGTTSISPDVKMVEFTENNDLFWAMRGGGAGTWGAVTAMTFKLHKPQNNCQTNCYQVLNALWVGNFLEDLGEMATVISNHILKWMSNPSRTVSGYLALGALENFDYYISIGEFMYVGDGMDDEPVSLINELKDLYPDKIASWNPKSYDTYFDKTQNQGPETTYVSGQYPVWTSVLVNRTILENSEDFVKSIWSMWVPRCINMGAYNETCTTTFQMHFTLPLNDDEVTDTSVVKKFREAEMHMTTGVAFNIDGELSPDESTAWIHEVLSPELYKYGSGSYYSESEYSMKSGQWQDRLWDKETYEKLLAVKQTWDPEHVFECRHCVGDESPVLEISEQTMPSWRFSK